MSRRLSISLFDFVKHIKINEMEKTNKSQKFENLVVHTKIFKSLRRW